LDTRDSDSFAGGFINESINIGLNGSFCPWAGILIDMDRELLLVTEPGKEKEALSELAKIGHDNIAGYLEGGIESWKNQNLSLETIECVEAENYKFMHETQEFVTIDLRSFEEIKKKNICQTISLPLEDLYKRINEFRKDVKYLLICNGGYRSIIAASILKSNGILNITNINGGILKMNY
jgi:rhodanese-related sulfurtransferase